MQHVTANAAQKDFAVILDCVLTQGDTVSIAADNGTAILVSQEEWNGMLETLYLQSIPGMTESILEGKATPVSECLDNVGWDIG